MSRVLRVAAVNWRIRHLRGDSQFFGHFHDLVSAAYDEGAQVVVFPELLVMELLPLAGGDLYAEDAPRYLVQYAQAIEEWIQRISDNSGMVIVGGSHFRQTPTGIRNVGAVAVPGEPLRFAEKNNLTGYERETWILEPGTGLVCLANGVGVNICYDSEFPEAGRALAEYGMTVHCVPSWTETKRGFQRVRWSCLARAVENQTFVVHSALVGDLGREPIPETYGSSAIIAPSVEPFPENAVLRESPLNEEAVIVADLSLDALDQARRPGDVANWADRHAADWNVLP